eukprot:Colp12_sorted_trinity150504_noHs@9584
MAACPHVNLIRIPPAGSKVYREECTQCFENQDSENGIHVCLHCYNGACIGDLQHAAGHARKFGHPVALNVKRIEMKEDSEPAQKITKLAIGVSGGANIDVHEYKYQKKLFCHECQVEIPYTEGPLSSVVEAVMQAPSQMRKDALQQWQDEVVACSHTKELKQLAGDAVASKAMAHCSSCELSNNLWLCLTCGCINCGRKNFDGTGGNGHALAHNQATGHPVALKLGTITPEGEGDIYCYACDETRLDPALAQHLSHFGIEVASQKQTEKSTKEMELDQNLTLTFSMTTEDGKPLEPAFGPGYTGLKNLGNSCYMASVLQSVFAIPEFQEKYLGGGMLHQSTCNESPATCLDCQLAKVAEGLLSGRFSIPIESEDADGTLSQEGVAPSMFKALIGHNHPEFSTARQQDALEFLLHMITKIEQAEQRRKGVPVTNVFNFTQEQKLQCTTCARVRYTRVKNNVVSLPIIESEPSLLTSLQRFGDVEEVDFNCPDCKVKGLAKKHQLFSTTPSVLALNVRRFVYADWVPKKLDTVLDVPDTLDLTTLLAGEHPAGEQLMTEEEEPAAAAASEPTFNAEALDSLMAMGVPEIRCKRALLATGNSSADAAINWVFEHSDDPDIDDPLPTSGAKAGPTADPASVAMLADMGFTSMHAERALKETGGNVERAVEWLFSHPDLGDAMAEDTPAEPADNETAGDTRSPVYDLFALITHKGTSVHCGHYVAHVKVNGEWVLFNDAKVAFAPKPPKGGAYIYLYRKRE